MSDERLRKEDMTALIALPAFRRFLWRVIQTSGILEPTTDGSEGRHLAYAEGRRNLGLEILADAEQGQPVAHPTGIPLLSVIQVLREEVQSTPQENAHGRRYDRNSELNGSDSDGSGD
jgi:hypothetical protein